MSGNVVYEGEFKDGIAHGQGVQKIGKDHEYSGNKLHNKQIITKTKVNWSMESAMEKESIHSKS